MAHVGKYYPYALGRDLNTLDWPSLPFPERLTLGTGLTISGNLSGGWNGSKQSSVATVDYTTGKITWLWQNVPGTNFRTSVRATYVLNMNPGSRKYFWQVVVAIDGLEGNVLDALSSYVSFSHRYEVNPGGQSVKNLPGETFAILWGTMQDVRW